MIDLIYLHRIREEVRRREYLRDRQPAQLSSLREFLAVFAPVRRKGADGRDGNAVTDTPSADRRAHGDPLAISEQVPKRSLGKEVGHAR